VTAPAEPARLSPRWTLPTPGSVALVGLAVLAAVLFPFVVDSSYLLGVATTGLVFVVTAGAFNLVFGYTGLLSLGQTGLWGIGAYTAALLVMDVGAHHGLALLAAGLVAGGVAVGIGYPAMKLSPGAFAIATLIFSLVMQLLAGDLEWLTRGQQGLPGLPPPQVGPLVADTPTGWYYLMLAFAAIALAVMHRLVRSRIGRSLVAIRENEQLAMSQGVDAHRYKLLVFTFAAVLTGLAGALHVFQLTLVHPSIFSFSYMEAILVIVMVGGPGHFWSVAIAAIVISTLPEFLRITDEFRLIAYGIALIAVVLLLPQGIGGLLEARRKTRPSSGAVR
jgi:branched-chain amino acid transport system permease protein